VFVTISREPIDTSGLVGRVRSDADGAVILFTGVVRNHHEGRQVVALRYEAYEAMASEKLRAICASVASTYEVTDLAVAHRIGDLTIGDVSVAIAVSAPHRDAAYKASREVIERLKREVPIWKLERYADGEEAWVKGAIPELG
jgi:molybdopterin synthase catalytic subunit